MTEHPNLAAALAAFQSEMPTAHKSKVADTGSYAYAYADLASIVEAVAPILGKHGLSYAGSARHVEGGKYELALDLGWRAAQVAARVREVRGWKADELRRVTR